MIVSGINLVMTVIGFAVSTMFIVFVCTRLICARIQLNASRRSVPIATRSDLNILEQGLHGLEPSVVANFPTKKYGDEFFNSTEDANCTVCLAECCKEDLMRIFPYCGHYFHAACIDVWLRQHSTCPVCRISLHEPPEMKISLLPSSAIRTSQHHVSLMASQYYLRLLGDRHGLTSSRHHHHHDSHRVMDTIQEDQFGPEGHGVAAQAPAPTGDGNGCLSESDRSGKGPEEKFVGSPPCPSDS